MSKSQLTLVWQIHDISSWDRLSNDVKSAVQNMAIASEAHRLNHTLYQTFNDLCILIDFQAETCLEHVFSMSAMFSRVALLQ